MCGPKFCSMEITQQIRDYARDHGVDAETAREQGMAETQRQLPRARRRVYTDEGGEFEAGG